MLSVPSPPLNSPQLPSPQLPSNPLPSTPLNSPPLNSPPLSSMRNALYLTTPIGLWRQPSRRYKEIFLEQLIFFFGRFRLIV